LTEETNADSLAEPELHTGIILRVNSGLFAVQRSEPGSVPGDVVSCTLRGNLRKKFTYSTSGSQPRRVVKAKQPFNHDSAAVGDRVRFQFVDSEVGIIEEILPRTTRFARTSFRGAEQTLVTNLDQLVIVFACAEPNPDLWRIDRWLVAAEVTGIVPLLIANKRDKVDDAVYHAAFDEFARIGYKVIATSAKSGIGIEELRQSLAGKISAFTGPSGVGKSSLLNALQPALKLDTGEIGEVTFKGRHTTTVRELFPLVTGGWVADTPGLRSLEMLKMDREDLLQMFVEFREPLENQCRFRNCKHGNEPGCMLKAAVESGEVSRRRYESFLQLAREAEPIVKH
jgi:ribosome biogenesis GTPase